MGKDVDRGGFWLSLSKMAFTRAVFQSNVFLSRLNAMQITVSFYTALKRAEHLAFLDSEATKSFISQQFIDQYKLGTCHMVIPRQLQNADCRRRTHPFHGIKGTYWRSSPPHSVLHCGHRHRQPHLRISMVCSNQCAPKLGRRHLSGLSNYLH